MAKKIKIKREPTEEEKKAEEAKAADEAQKAAAGIQDDFQARGFELVEWVHEKQALVLGFIAVVLLVGAAYATAGVLRRGSDAEASAALKAGLDALEAPLLTDAGKADDKADPAVQKFPDATARATAARDLFKKAAKEHASRGAGVVAHLYAGHAALKLNDAADAAAEYRAFLDSAGAADPLRFAGEAGLATALETSGDTKGSIAALEALIALPEQIGEDGALFDVARLKKEASDIPGARAALERLAKDFPTSPMKTRADELLASLGTTAPAGAAGGDEPRQP